MLLRICIGLRNASTTIALYCNFVCTNITDLAVPLPPVLAFSTTVAMQCAFSLNPAVLTE
jgi:hypothetical protein